MINSQKRKIHLVVAARPNFVKIAPLYHALRKETWAEPVIVHTGQHYDFNMSDAFFQNLELPNPNIHLGVGSGTHAEQTGKVMIAYEKSALNGPKPNLVVVAGDVNSTAAVAFACAKSGLTVGHLEAGLRSFDRSMPEEINRVVTDAVADILWTPSPDADENLFREGIDKDRIERVGNIMIDSLEMARPAIERKAFYQELGLVPGQYGIVTLHRPSNVDSAEQLKPLFVSLAHISRELPLVFPLHPRTKKNMEIFGLNHILAGAPGLHICEPLPYISFMSLVFNCHVAITDSGGIQEETTYLGIPCITIRSNTERPITVLQGTNVLCDIGDLENRFSQAVKRNFKGYRAPELWDGRTATRLIASIKRLLHVDNV